MAAGAMALRARHYGAENDDGRLDRRRRSVKSFEDSDAGDDTGRGRTRSAWRCGDGRLRMRVHWTMTSRGGAAVPGRNARESPTSGPSNRSAHRCLPSQRGFNPCQRFASASRSESAHVEQLRGDMSQSDRKSRRGHVRRFSLLLGFAGYNCFGFCGLAVSRSSRWLSGRIG